MNFCLFLLDRSQIFLVTSTIFKNSSNGQIHGRIASGRLLMLSCVGYLTAQRFLRDASLCNKEFCINLAISEVKELNFSFTLLSASSAPNTAANRRTN
jgi:hypothetical protein